MEDKSDSTLGSLVWSYSLDFICSAQVTGARYSVEWLVGRPNCTEQSDLFSQKQSACTYLTLRYLLENEAGQSFLGSSILICLFLA